MTEPLAKILVVDDIPANRLLAGKILAGEFEVDSVKSGEEALDFFTRKIPDLVLLDIYMEGIDGFELLEKMRAVPQTADIPVVFLTADDDHEVETRGFKAGAVDFITKPFIATVLQQRVRRIVELFRLRHQLQQEVERQTAKTQRLSIQIVQSLVNTIEARGKNINGHSERVAKLAVDIAHGLHLSDDAQDTIFYMGLLHNIGKIAVPDEIVSKEDDLTEAELEIVQQSTVIGANIMRDVTEMPTLWQGAKYHEEHYDGTGYPDGLKGKAIPIGARILAAACDWDRMLEEKKLSPAQARERLQAGSGTLYDPEVVATMLALLPRD